MPFDYLRSEAKAQRMGSRLLAIVAEGDRGRAYLPPTAVQAQMATTVQPNWTPDIDLPQRALGFRVQEYGMRQWRDLFTSRQLVALSTLSDLVFEVQDVVMECAERVGMEADAPGLADGGTGARAYAEAVGVYLALLVDQVANHCSSVCGWNNANTQMRSVFARQAIPMVWDFAESNPFCKSSGSYSNLFDRQVKGFVSLGNDVAGTAIQADVNHESLVSGRLVSTDPPYYDNIGYADLSDFFYVWLRRALRPTYPDLFKMVATPKADELIASPYRQGSPGAAEQFFLDGMERAISRIACQAHPGFPVIVFYAYKQLERKGDAGSVSTGWEMFLDAVIRSGFGITGTWPMRTERSNRMLGIGTNALASSIVLVCRGHARNAPQATRREYHAALRRELQQALALLQSGNIAPVDLAQAAIGPGMAVYTRYAKVLDASGKPMSVREALALINHVLDEVLVEQEGNFDSDTRWALDWFNQYGFDEGDFGDAETLSKAKNTSVKGMKEAGVLESGTGKVRLLKPQELSSRWQPHAGASIWKTVHHLIHVHETDGDKGAAGIVRHPDCDADIARDLCYRLYTLSERKNKATEALWYNSLIQSWSEILRLAQAASQTELF